MSIITSQEIIRYYEQYKDIEVTFNKHVIQATGLLTKQVFLKCLGQQWPCIIYSSSMLSAKVIASLKSTHFETLKKAHNLVNLRLSFKISEKEDPISFFVSTKTAGFNKYNKENPDIYFITLNFTQRPPDNLIEMLGKLLEANINAKKRKDKRILITPESIRKLSLKGKEAFIYVESIPRKCIIRDLSFSGAKVLLFGIAKFLINKKAVLRIAFEDIKQPVEIAGEIIRFEPVEGRKDIAAVAIHFNEDKVPMEYKIRINDYLKHTRDIPQIS
ncbi:MAG: PilZ domain-containing protein [Spirochaetales bacterium]|nr:PilZ domain-containing protein [Spirochaetales bacterium]